MIRLALASLACVSLALTACDAPRTDPDDTVSPPAGEGTTTADTAETPPPETAAHAGYADGSGVNEGYPDLAPTPLDGDAERGAKGARNVLLSFVRALELKEFDQAYAMTRGQTREGTSAAQLTRRFADFGDISVAAPSGTIEGAAGTLYYTAPVTITGSNGDELTGEIVLSRVNDVPGASEEQLRWRVARLDLSPAD